MNCQTIGTTSASEEFSRRSSAVLMIFAIVGALLAIWIVATEPYGPLGYATNDRLSWQVHKLLSSDSFPRDIQLHSLASGVDAGPRAIVGKLDGEEVEITAPSLGFGYILERSFGVWVVRTNGEELKRPYSPEVSRRIYQDARDIRELLILHLARKDAAIRDENTRLDAEAAAGKTWSH